MANLAALHADRRMFECEGATLIGMALNTGLFVSECLIDQSGTCGHAPGGSKRAVRVMTVTADHDALIHAVLEGHREVGPDVTVATVTELRLAFRQ